MSRKTPNQSAKIKVIVTDGLKLSLAGEGCTIEALLSPDEALSLASLLIFEAQNELYLQKLRHTEALADLSK